MQKYKNIIKNIAEYKNIPLSQSYLICSEDSLLNELFVRFYIESLINKFESADIINLPEKEKITVADIDYLTTTALISPLELSHKYYIIKNGDSMQDAAANKLLKTLEEPPSSAKIFILVSNERVVLPTIRSRCAVINLSLPNEADLLNVLDDKNPNYILSKEVSLGSLTRLEGMLNGEYNDIFETVFQMLLYMRSSSHILNYSSKFTQHKDNIDKLLWSLDFVLHQVLKYNLSQELNFKSRHKDVSIIAEFYCVDTILRLKPVIEKAHKRLAVYGNVQSIIDELLFSILEVRQKCNKQN